MPTFDTLRPTYAALWASMEIRPSKAGDINATAARILANKVRYQEVEIATQVPWFVVGVIHAMEAGLSFTCHLHNGDPLTARTRQVPRGRPKEGSPPFTWKDSAIDAIRYDGLDKVDEWTIERICFELEKYNGWGYAVHHPDVNTPYLWSGSNQYSRGKYVSDGQWSSNAVSGQSGAMPIIKRIMELDAGVTASIHLAGGVAGGLAGGAATSVEAGFPKATASSPTSLVGVAKTVQASHSLWAIINGWVVGIVAMFTDWIQHCFTWIVSLITDITQTVDDTGAIDSASKLQDWLQIDQAKVLKFTLAIVAVVSIIVFVRHLRDKQASPPAN